MSGTALVLLLALGGVLGLAISAWRNYILRTLGLRKATRLVTHDAMVSSRAPRIVRINNGRIEDSGGAGP